MASADVPSSCDAVFHHLTRELTTCTEPCVKPVGQRPESPHRCAAGHEWLIDAQGIPPDADSPDT